MDDRNLLSEGSSLSSTDQLSEVPVVTCNLCAINPPIDPVVTTCGHSFCWPCIYRFLQGQAKPCPVCTAKLGSDFNVVPYLQENGALILCLPTIEDLERNYDMLDWIRTNTVLPGVSVPALAPGASSGSEESGKRDVVVFDGGSNLTSNSNCQRNVLLTSRVEELQWRASRAKRTLLNSWESGVEYWKKITRSE